MPVVPGTKEPSKIRTFRGDGGLVRSLIVVAMPENISHHKTSDFGRIRRRSFWPGDCILSPQGLTMTMDQRCWSGGGGTEAVSRRSGLKRKFLASTLAAVILVPAFGSLFAFAPGVG